jgi:hypothetical protein
MAYTKTIFPSFNKDEVTGQIIKEKVKTTIKVHPLQPIIFMESMCDEFIGVKLQDKLGNYLTRVNNKNEIDTTHFYLSNNEQKIFVDPSYMGELMTIEYYSIGGYKFSDKLVATQYDESNTVTETLNDIITQGRASIDFYNASGSAIQLQDDLEATIVQANSKIIEGETTITNIEDAIANGDISAIQSDIVNINSSLANTITHYSLEYEKQELENDYTPALERIMEKIKINFGGTILLPPKNCSLSKSIKITHSNVTFKGTRGISRLIWTASDDGSAFNIINTTPVNSLVFDGFVMEDTTSTLTAIRINGLIDRSFADSIFSSLKIYGFLLGMKTSYSWCNLFQDVRFQNCVTVLDLGSQTNNMEFIRCSFVSSTYSFNFTNCEGINFTSCNIANVNGTCFNKIFQSTIQFINPYFEYIDNWGIIGTTAETFPSSLTIIGGKHTEGEILNLKLGGYKSHIAINGKIRLDNIEIGQKSSSFTGFLNSTNIDVNSTTDNYKTKLIREWYGNIPCIYPRSSGGGYPPTELRNGYCNITTLTNNGIKIVGDLTVGKAYTLVYAIRSSFNYVIKHDSNSIKLGGVVPLTSDFRLAYIPFVAFGTSIDLIGSSDQNMDIAYIGLFEGSVFPEKELGGKDIYSLIVPTTGVWNKGDRVLNYSPSVGQPIGWVCTVSGTPGTWVVMANL